MPEILAVIPSGNGFEITIRKDADTEFATGKVFSYPSKKMAHEHKKRGAHQVGSWVASADESEGTGALPNTVRSQFVIVNQKGTPTTWSKPFRVGGTLQ